MENTLLCWSVIACPSTENELDAWSPRPWNRPFESAATPGLVSVTSELREEDWLSSGTVMNMSRSTSVWKVGSFSMRSPPASTFTVGGGSGDVHNQLSCGSHRRANLDILAQWAKPVAETVIVVGVERNVGKRELAAVRLWSWFCQVR